MFSGVVLVDGRPERSSSFTDVRPSLKHLYHKKVLLGLIAFLPNASTSMRGVSTEVFLSLKQNLMQILCSLKSAIYAGIKNRRTTKTQRYKNARNSRTRPLAFTVFGTLILSAAGHTTNGSRVANSPNFWVARRRIKERTLSDQPVLQIYMASERFVNGLQGKEDDDV
jgi:hypothetical protein